MEAKTRVCAKIDCASCLCQLLVHCPCGPTAASATEIKWVWFASGGHAVAAVLPGSSEEEPTV